jgi:DNA-binding beta-propeller fold protein YncE
MLTTLLFLGAAIALPGGPPVGMDYLAFDAARGRVWVPAGNTGNVDVIDVASGKLTPLGGFATKPSTRPGRPNMGPSSVTVAGDTVWVGSRGDDSLCSFDAKTLAKGECIKLAAMPDGVQWVAATRELWVTTPREQTLTIVDPKSKAIATIKLPGDPEGYAVDGERFYTNLEDKDKTLALDVKTRKVVATWEPGCGAEGPRGLALDGAKKRLFVACTDGAATLDVKDGKVLGRIKTGGGVDNIDWFAPKKRLYVASSKDGTLTIAEARDDGSLAAVETTPTSKGARNAIVDATGTAYVPDGAGGKLIVIKPAK